MSPVANVLYLFVCNLQIFEINLSVCPRVAFPTWSVKHSSLVWKISKLRTKKFYSNGPDVRSRKKYFPKSYKTFFRRHWRWGTIAKYRFQFEPSLMFAISNRHRQGILKGEVSLYCWPPVCLVWNQLYDYWKFLFLSVKQTNPNQSNRRSTVQWYFPL